MDIGRAFTLGGWGMWPTAFFGLLLIGVAVLYAARPERRFLPLLGATATMTLISGGLGFISGLIHSCLYLNKVGPDERFLVLIGLAESLYNVVFALVLLMLAAIAAAVGAVRIARQRQPNAAVAAKAAAT